MYRRRILAILLSVAVAAGSLSAGKWCATAAEGTTVSNHVEILEKVPTRNADGMTHYHIENEEGEEVSLQQGTSKSHYMKRVAVLPESYDPRGSEQETPIRDQEDTGACWAFGALKALETDCIRKGILTEEQADLSENHLAWYAYHGLQNVNNPLYGDYIGTDVFREEDCYNIGGNALIALNVLANRWGAVWEEDAPFSTKKKMAEAMALAEDSLRFQSVIHMTESNCYDPNPDDPFNEENRNGIKQAVIEHGAMDVALYYSNTLVANKDGVYSSYTNRRTAVEANHCVTIVGWDDNFNSFQKEPPAPGAWLIANSYGTDYNENGYFWVSYYDTSLCEFYTFEGVAGNTYGTVFQYDGMGWGAAVGSEQLIKTANVFQASTTQKLEAVSFHTVAENQPYTIDIFRNLQNSNPKSGEWVSRCTVSGVMEHTGYHTVSLAEPIGVAAGESFSAIVTYYPVEGKAYAPVEGRTSRQNGLYFHAEQGQSYLYLAEDETWYDNTAINLEGMEYNMNNSCVKVFSNTMSEQAYREQQVGYVPATPEPDATKTPSPNITPTNSLGTDKLMQTAAPRTTNNTQSSSAPGREVQIKCTSKFTIGKGEKFALPLKVTPAGSKSSLKYSSSNSKIASVSNSGKISGKKAGTAKITVRAASGAKKMITVKVKKAPKTIVLRAGKTTLKKGKTMQLKTSLTKGSASYQLQYRCSNKKIATVNARGKVTAKKRGTVRITVSTYNHRKSSVKIRVISG